MNLLGKALVFVLMGCASTQNFGQPPEGFGNQGRFDFGNNGNSPFGSGGNSPFGSGGNSPFGSGGNSPFGNSGNSPFGGNANGPFGDNPELNQVMMQGKSFFDLIPHLLKQKCDESGHSDVLQSIQEQLGQTQKCLKDKVNLDGEKLADEFAGASRTGELDNFFKKNCKVWPDIHGCVQPMVTSAEKCLTSDEKRTVEKLFSLADDTNTFFCENNADRLKKLLSGNLAQCMETVGKDVQECAAKTLQNRQKQQQQQQKQQTSDKKVIFSFDEETCSDFQSGRKCVTSKVAKCESKDTSKIVDDYLALVQDHVCSSASSLSWFSFANILLLVGTYLYSRMF
ncbi:27 kDa glycoprotein [Diabrotica virgifera virgifera]|uniref:Uncharacterized protein n=1 Tax=Diabrotica virgifera virgifera TaxID=50390 RepID=A0ABM5IPW8_DIAVI|nr:27 kDa glycoprotein [Diabrotica virgifera virgifera]